MYTELIPCVLYNFFFSQRIATSTREGGPLALHLERFVEALADPSTNLTYYALTGARKQSVQDAERLLSLEVAHFMKNKKYNTEATYVRVIANWCRACDERGLIIRITKVLLQL